MIFRLIAILSGRLGWRHRRDAGVAALLALVFALAGCGFHPLYGQNSYDSAVLSELASIRVTPMANRQGQLLHNALLTDLSPRGEPDHPRYRLDVRMNMFEYQQALRTDDTATRDIVNYTISYYLYDDKTRILTGTFIQNYSYDFLQQQYANVTAAEDITRRATQAIADEIRNRLAAYFAKAAEVKAQSANTP
jgi:LPS-assembly lipoprotein